MDQVERFLLVAAGESEAVVKAGGKAASALLSYSSGSAWTAERTAVLGNVLAKMLRSYTVSFREREGERGKEKRGRERRAIGSRGREGGGEREEREEREGERGGSRGTRSLGSLSSRPLISEPLRAPPTLLKLNHPRTPPSPSRRPSSPPSRASPRRSPCLSFFLSSSSGTCRRSPRVSGRSRRPA